MFDQNLTFGEVLKELRLRTGLTLRKFCEKYDLDAGNFSKLERGVLPPPTSKEKLEHLANCLGLEPYSAEWYYFFDHAAAAAGRIPADVMSDEELVKKLPLVFRTMRGDRLSDDNVDTLIDIIRKA